MISENPRANEDMWCRLARPFTSDEIEWRVGRCGRGDNGIWALLLPYVDSRAIQRRLDAVLGPEGWEDQYREISGGGGGMVCSLTIFIGDGQIVKEGCASFSNIESIKGGESVSLKRAAVKFGIGRYLYAIGERWAADIQDGRPPNDRPTVSIISKGKSANDRIFAWCVPPKIDDAVLRQIRMQAAELIRDWSGSLNGDELRETIVTVAEAAGITIDESRPLAYGDWQHIVNFCNSNRSLPLTEALKQSA